MITMAFEKAEEKYQQISDSCLRVLKDVLGR